MRQASRHRRKFPRRDCHRRGRLRQLRGIDPLEGVELAVVRDPEVVERILHREESRNAGVVERVVVGIVGALERQLDDAEIVERRNRGSHEASGVFASLQSEAAHLPGPEIENEHRLHPRQLGSMSLHVGLGAEVALLLSGKEHDADGTARLESHGGDGPERFHHAGHASAVVG